MFLNLLIVLLFLSITSTGEGGKKKNVDTIIIHVPYKILKHHHTHTKYKIITIPEKKEKTVIYVKALDTQPNTKYTTITRFPEPNLEMEIIKRQPKEFYPSQQLLDSSVTHIIKDQKETEAKDQQQDFSENMHSVKPAQFHIFPQHEDAHNDFIQKFTFPTIISHSHEVPPKPRLIRTMLPPLPTSHHTHSHYHQYQEYNSKAQQKPVLHPLKQVQHHKDNMHSSSNIYQSAITPNLQKSSSYKVREPSLENHHHTQLAQYQQKPLLNNFKVPSLNSYDKKTPNYFNQDNEYLNTNLRENEVKQDDEAEYEHVGYLVIDENSQKIVDKNFNEKFHSWG